VLLHSRADLGPKRLNLVGALLPRPRVSGPLLETSLPQPVQRRHVEDLGDPFLPPNVLVNRTDMSRRAAGGIENARALSRTKTEQTRHEKAATNRNFAG
jgi:hypothetical protein